MWTAPCAARMTCISFDLSNPTIEINRDTDSDANHKHGILYKGMIEADEHSHQQPRKH